MKNIPLVLLLLWATQALAQREHASELNDYSRGVVPASVPDDLRGGGPPLNDECANATVVTLTTNCYNPIAGDNTNATSGGPQPSCDDPGATTLDLWYTFTTGSTGATAITLAPSAAMTDWEYVLYEATCDGNEVACRILPVLGQQEMLAPATTYWLRVYSNPDYGTPGPFTLCIQDLALFTPPANDDCANLVSAPLAVGASVTFTGDATFALNTEGLPFNSVWNAFTTTEAADVHIDLCGTTSSLGFTWLALYLTCPANLNDRIFAGSYVNCPNGLADLCYGHLPAGTYYYAVSNALSAGSYSVEVSAEPIGTNSPINDDCAGAIPLSGGTWCDPTTFSPSCASASPAPGGCLEGLANPEDDVWYSFTATGSEMSLGILPHSLQFGPIIEVFSGSCGALTSVGCANGFAGDTLEINMNTLVPGNVYFVQVYNGYYSTPTDDAGYDLCVVDGLGINIGVSELDEGSGLGIYPNPNLGDFTVRTRSAPAQVKIDVFDALGRNVSFTTLFAQDGLHRIAITGAAAGVHLVRIDTGNEVLMERVVVSAP